MINAKAEGRETRIDPRVKRTRKLLTNAFEQLLAEKDFQSITVNDITDRAEVNRATFYLHFDDKYALLSYSLREAFTKMLEQRLPDTHLFSMNHLTLLTVTLCEFMSNFYGHCHPGARNDDMTLIVARLQQQVYDLLLEWIISGGPKLQDKAGSQQPSAEYTASALSWLIFGTAIQAQIAKSKQSPEEWVEQMLALVRPGLQALLGDLAGN